MTYTNDYRYSAGASGATAPDDAPAAYSARWIDKGDVAPADVLPDRQGFAYNTKAEMEALIMMMDKAGDWLRIPYSCGYQERDVTTLVIDTPYWRCYVRRSGGYIYVDAWLTPPIDNPPAVDVELSEPKVAQYLVTIREPGNITNDPRNIHTILTSTDNIQPRDRVTVEVYP